MRFEPTLVPGRFVRRYQRFFADFALDDGRTVTAHCPNPGSMKSCLKPGARSWLSRNDDPRRKLAYTWEVTQIGKVRIFVNPVRVNSVAYEALSTSTIVELGGYETLEREVPFGPHSRVDFRLGRGQSRCYVEVKSVTLGLGRGRAAFPDAVTQRGTRHLEALIQMCHLGHRAVLLFCASRSDATSVEPADDIDPVYGQTLRRAVHEGVEVLAYRTAITPEQVRMSHAVPVLL